MVMKKIMSILLCAALLTGSAAMAESAAYTAGTYTAAGKGMGGDVNVSVTFTEDAITEVVVGDHSETAGICESAIERVPAEIVEYQSLKVDAVAGATVTSGAILEAVAICVEQAGGDAEALKSKEIVKEQLADETIDTDVVVVGGGIAGLSAAIEAAQAGAKVVLVEKMAATGGASITCGGEVLAAGTAMQKAQGIEDTPSALGDLWVAKGEGHANEDILRAVAENNAGTIDWMVENGVEFSGVTTPTSYPWQNPMRCHKTVSGNGAGFILPLTEKALALGVELRLETPASSLINMDGVIQGVICENAGRTVTVNAKSVILATGGYGNNIELMNEYALPEVPKYGVRVGEANQGDGLIMARDAGAEIVSGGGAIALALEMGPTQFFEPYGQFLYVAQNGKRFMNEAEYWFSRTRKLYDLGGYYYLLADGKTENPGWTEAIAKGSAVQADSIEALAEAIGMDAGTLSATVETYNGYCATGVDEEFGKPASNLGMYLTKGPTDENPGVIEQKTQEMKLLTALDTAPYYAVKVGLNSLSGTFGGPKVNLNGQVISTTGEVIPGLYAAGEVASGELFYKEYPCSGSAIQLYCSLGRLAGTAAAQEALSK